MALEDFSPTDRFMLRLARLSPLAAEERAALQDLRGRIVQVNAGVDLIQPGSHPDHVHLIVEGLCGRFAQFSDGNRQITALHIPGDVPDLHGAVAPAVAPSLQALITTTAVRIPRQHMAALARAHPTIGEAFWAYSSFDAALLERWAANLGRRTAPQRMAHLLCEMALRLEDADRGDRLDFVLPITQPQLGDALGLTPVHVNRTLKMLREQELATVKGRRFVIHDWDRLADLGDFDPAYLLLGRIRPPHRRAREVAA